MNKSDDINTPTGNDPMAQMELEFQKMMGERITDSNCEPSDDLDGLGSSNLDTRHPKAIVQDRAKQALLETCITVNDEERGIFGKFMRGTINMCTGSGKSKIIVDIVQGYNDYGNEGEKDGKGNIREHSVIVVPTKNLRDSNWPEEFKKWCPNWSEITMDLEIICYASLNKLEAISDWCIERSKTLNVFFDECHTLTENSIEYVRPLIEKNLIQDCVAISATTEDDKQRLLDSIGLPRIFNYSLEEAVKDGVVPPYRIIVVPVPLDIRNNLEISYKAKKGKDIGKHKTFKTSEKEKYAYWEEAYGKQLGYLESGIRRFEKNCAMDMLHGRFNPFLRDMGGNGKKDLSNRFKRVRNEINNLVSKNPAQKEELLSHLDALRTVYKEHSFKLWNAIRERTNFIYNSQSKEKVAKYIISKLRDDDKRLIIFGQSIASVKKLTNYCVNPTDKNTSLIQDFNAKKIDEIGACKMMNAGENLVDIECSVIGQLTSKTLDLVQRVGRTLRAKDQALVFILVLEGTQDEKWLKNAIKDFDPEFIEKSSIGYSIVYDEEFEEDVY